MGIMRALWKFRGFIAGSVKREFQSKYQNSVLGAAWTVINPLAMIVVYTVIFAQVMQAKLPGVDKTFAYSIYLCAGLLTWSLFAEIISRTQNIFIDNANLLKKLNFPRLCLPVTVVASATLNFAILFGIFTVFLIGSGNFPGWPYLAMLPVITVQIFLAVGIGVGVGVLNVFFRDIGQFFSLFLQFWFWFTPIVYPLAILPERLQPLMSLNPMARLTKAYQTILMDGQWPNWQALWPVVVASIVLCMLGFHLFRIHSAEIVDEL